MLSFFRNFTKSRFGLIVVFIVLGIIALAFGLTDITGMRTGGGPGGGVVAKVGSQEIGAAEVRDRIDRFLADIRREGRQVTMEQFVAQGGLEQAIDEMINNAAMIEFARENGMVVTKGLVDSEIASMPVFQGVDGKFSQRAFDQLLVQQRISPQQLRDDFMRARYGSWLINPTLAANQVPDKVIALLASALLERRKGLAGMIRIDQMGEVTDPDDKTLTAYYTANRGRYMIPARRVIRYASVKADEIRARSAATDAEIAEAYRKAGTRFAAKEKRSVRQLVLIDQATANRVAGEVKAGKAITAVAADLKLEAGNFENLEKAELQRLTSAPIADAAFGGAQGAVLGPIRSPLGWVVLQVEKVESIAARSLDQARADLAREVTEKKTLTTLVNLRQEIEDEIGDGATFDEAAAKAKLNVARIGPVAASGTNPDDPASKADPALATIVRAGFAGEPGDEPQLAPLGEDGSFALVAPERVIAAAPRPIATIRETVLKDYRIGEQMKRAQAKAAEIVRKVNGGMPIAQAYTEAGLPVAFKAFDYVVGDVGKGGEPSQEVIVSLRVQAGKAQSFPDKERRGVLLVNITSVEQRDATNDKEAMDRIRGTVSPMIGRELSAQFIEAIRRSVKVTRNEAAIAKLKADLTGASQR
jgi:peptidyl-prolyl cis-trans isomerase D